MKTILSVKPGLAALAAGLLFIFPASSPAAGAGFVFAPEAGMAHKSKDVSPPALALDEKGTVYVAWTEEEKEGVSVYLSSSPDGGRTYGNPVRVNAAADAPSAVHNPPSLALGRSGEIYVAWTTPKAGGEFASDIRFSRSADGGKSFSPSIKVNDASGPVSAGFESMTVSSNGKIYMAWLDGRERNEKNKGVSATFFSASDDGGKTFAPNVRVDGNSCPCCRTAVTAGPDGAVYVSWRKVFDGDVREIVLSVSRDGGKTFSVPSIVGNDKWVIAGCPHRGPSLGAMADGTVFAAWYSEGDGLPKIYLGKSGDGGKTFARQEMKFQPGFFPDHPAVAVAPGGLMAVWEEVTPVMGRVMFSAPDGGAPEQLSQGPRRSGYPVIAVNGAGGVAVGWSKDEMKITRTLVRVGAPAGHP